MSKLDLTLVLENKNGDQYKFDIYSKDHSFKESWGGIYVFLKMDNPKNTALVKYIGMSVEFKLRFDNHSKINLEGINCIGIMKESLESKRRVIEKSLIEKYKPTLNSQLKN